MSARRPFRDAWGLGINFDADMVCDEANDAFTIGRDKRFASVGETFGEAINSDAAVRVQHHFDDGGVVQEVRVRPYQETIVVARGICASTIAEPPRGAWAGLATIVPPTTLS